MSSLTQRLGDSLPTSRTILTGVVRWHAYRHHTKYLPKIFQPISESRPCSIGNRLSQFFVPNHIPHLQVLIGNQVVRLDDAPCQLYGKVFTLPTYLEVLSTQTISRIDSVVRTIKSLGKSATKTLERFLRLSQVTGIFNGLPVGIGVEVSQANIQPNGFTRWLSLLYSFLVETKLNVVSVSSTDNPHSLNLLQLIEVQVTGSPHFETSSFKPISERDSSPINEQLPPCGFVLNRAMSLMFFKTWKTFVSWSALVAVVVEPSDRTPSPFSRSLPSLRVKFASERELFAENSAICAQLVLPDSLVVHPVSEATVANKTRSTNGFIKPFILLLCSLKFCLEYQHDYADATGVSLS